MKLLLPLTLAFLASCGGSTQSEPLTNAVGKSEFVIDVTGMS